jgi:ATP-dependent Clp protease protease subunit
VSDDITEQEVEEYEEIVHDMVQEEVSVRKVMLYGDITEESSLELIGSLFSIKEYDREVDPETGEYIYEPFELYISTYGGSAADMFAIYDVMRQIRKDCTISTVGIGKVYSAGTLLLAAGTKGERKIGRNCKVMIHDIVSGTSGSLHDIKNELKEINMIQAQYIATMVKETSMSEKQIKNLIKRKVNVYLTAEQAVEMGIADEVI